MNNNKPIIILGGMGPQASVRLLEVLINVCVKDFGAKSDPDFPELILNSIPVPNFVANKNKIDIVRTMLIQRVRSLGKQNPSCFGIACNTAHVMLNELQSSTRVPFVSIIDEVAKSINNSNLNPIGLLATPVTIKSGLYQNALRNKNIDLIIPSAIEIKVIEKVIRNILAGKIDFNDKSKLVSVAQSLKKRGAKGIILGCTELPLIFPKNFDLPIFDSIEILARALIKKSKRY